jgi:transposase
MSTKPHDDMISEAVRWAKSLGYGIVEFHLGTETGADAVFQNYFGEKVILEVVTGANFRNLFEKPRIKQALESRGEKEHWPEILGLIVVGDRIDHVKDHGVEVGVPNELFDHPEKQRVFPVETRHFDRLIPVLLVSLLGIRASAKARVW